MFDKRRIDPSLTEAEFALLRAAYPDLEINRDPSGIIIMSCGAYNYRIVLYTAKRMTDDTSSRPVDIGKTGDRQSLSNF